MIRVRSHDTSEVTSLSFSAASSLMNSSCCRSTSNLTLLSTISPIVSATSTSVSSTTASGNEERVVLRAVDVGTSSGRKRARERSSSEAGTCW